MNQPRKYVKKPVVIEAMLFEGGVMDWFHVEKFVGRDILFPYAMNPGTASLHIKTNSGLAEVRVGDYIIKGINGEFYPCAPDVFLASHSEIKPIESSELTPEELALVKEDT